MSADPVLEQAVGPPVQPDKQWRGRTVDPEQEREAIRAGLTPAQAAIVAGRVRGLDAEGVRERFLDLPLRALHHPDGLPDIERAAQRIVAAVLGGESIACVTDHDVDGVTSHAILYRALTEVMGHPVHRVQSFIGHRLKEGYGLSDAVVDRILAGDQRPALVITADHGSADEPRIARLRAAGIDTVVTDHHAIPASGIPDSAYACVSPVRADSVYGDRAIAGCMVAWLLMMHAEKRLREMREQAPNPERRAIVVGLLAEVAAGTVADCVNLGESVNNRVAVHRGLERVNRVKSRTAAWRHIHATLGGEKGFVDASDLAFGLGPRINARGRLDEAMGGVRLLLAGSDEEASQWWEMLERENRERRRIEKELTRVALDDAASQVAQGRTGLAIWLENGHPGVHGIVASRVVEAFGRPALCLSPVWESTGEVTGSARGVPGVHVAQALSAMVASAKGLLDRHGGHAGAGGLRASRARLGQILAAWDDACGRQVREQGLQPGPVLELDDASCAPAALRDLHEIENLAPFGRGFERPLFAYSGTLGRVRRIGDGSHVSFLLATQERSIRAVYFNALDLEEPMPWVEGQAVEVAASPSINHYQGTQSLQLVVRDLRATTPARRSSD